MIALFGITIGSEVFAVHSDILLCESEGHSCVGGAADHSQISESDAAHETACADPCHFGQCHFGHCSFAFGRSSWGLHALAPVVKEYFFAAWNIESALVQGLRRPPRTV